MSAARAVLFRLATSARLERAVRALPPGETRAWRAASRYVAGTTFADAGRTARELDQRGVGSSIDQFGELVDAASTAEQVAADYVRLAGELAAVTDSAWLSVDLSHLGLDVDPERCREHLAAIAAALPDGRRIQVGAEDHDRTDPVLACILAVAENGLADHLGATLQANFRRSPRDLDRLVEAGVHVRLVKGAYVEQSVRALAYGEPTDIAYVQLAHRLADARTSPWRPTTAYCGRRCSRRSARARSNSCWASARRCWTTSLPAASRYACTCRSVTPGSAIGCVASPSPAEPETRAQTRGSIVPRWSWRWSTSRVTG